MRFFLRPSSTASTPQRDIAEKLPVEAGPASPERRKRQLVCAACGGTDVVRTRSANPIVRFLGELWGKKRFSCRSCGEFFYSFARRSADKTIPVEEELPPGATQPMSRQLHDHPSKP